jgi:hypothetical protein
MGKQSRKSTIKELVARKIEFTEQMSDENLAGLLKEANDKEKPETPEKMEENAKKAKEREEATERPSEKPVEEKPIDCSEVVCGIGQAQDHHRRITRIERKLGM